MLLMSNDAIALIASGPAMLTKIIDEARTLSYYERLVVLDLEREHPTWLMEAKDEKEATEIRQSFKNAHPGGFALKLLIEDHHVETTYL